MSSWQDNGLWVLQLSTAFGLQLIGYFIAILTHSEVFYDLFGSITFVLVALESYNTKSLVSKVATILVIIWASRLGSFLFFRVLKTGGDSRFDTIRANRVAFLVAWMMQGIWVIATLLPLMLVTMDADLRSWQLVLGVGMWCFGFLLETIADVQKFIFKSKAENSKRIIDVGVWSWCKYPNYFGEILLWCGICITCTSSLDVLSSWKTVAMSLVSPVFVILLLCFVSGIPIQEKQALSRWGQSWEEDDRNLLIPSYTKIYRSIFTN